MLQRAKTISIPRPNMSSDRAEQKCIFLILET